MDAEPTLDPESQKQLTDAEEVQLMLNSKGWAIAKQKLDEKILDLQNIANLDEQNLAVDLKARIMASKILFEWAKNDVYGFVHQVNTNLSSPQENPEYIGRG